MPDFYGTAAGFDTYHTDRGRDVSAYTDTEVEAALLVATEWVDTGWRFQFPGYRKEGRDQPREWPRYAAFDYEGEAIASDSVPVEVANATYEAALRELQEPGALSKDYTASKYTRVSISGAVDVTYAQMQVAEVQTRIQIVEEILMPILDPARVSSMLSGATVRV